MGFYYTTYLHYGEFDKNRTSEYTIVATMDPIIEYHEKEQGFVSREDIETFLKKNSISFEFKEKSYITEVNTCTLEPGLEDLYTTLSVI